MIYKLTISILCCSKAQKNMLTIFSVDTNVEYFSISLAYILSEIHIVDIRKQKKN